MANYVQVPVVCPCGRLLKTVNSNTEFNGKTTSSHQCPSCKKQVAIQVCAGKSYTSYK